MTTDSNSLNRSELPLIPLSPIVQSYIISTNALNLATEKLAEAKKADPPVPVDTLRSFMDTSRVESHRLSSLTRKMQTVESATAAFWDSDALARQIAIIDSQLFGKSILDKRSLHQSKLNHLADFHHYLTHSFAHQLIYWVELLNNHVAAAAVVPAVNSSKDSLVAHLVRVAYLLLHAYRDFSGFAAIMRALTFPEVKRLEKKLWSNCTSSRTRDMFRDLVQIISPEKNYHAYQTCIRAKLETHYHDDMMAAIPWVQPHLLSIRSIIEEYTAGDNEYSSFGGDIVLSTPGINKLDMEISFLELCQRCSSRTDFSVEEILTANGTYDIKRNNHHKRASSANSSAPKAIHIDGLRAAVIPVANLAHLPPGEQLIHHWLVSRAYLRKDQLIHESLEVEPLRPGEKTLTSEQPDPFDNTILYHTFPKPAASIIPQKSDTNLNNEHDDQESILETDKHEVTPSNNELLTEEEKAQTIDTTPPKSTHSNSTGASKPKSRLSPSAPEFIPKSFQKTHNSTTATTDERWLGYPANDHDEDDDDMATLTTESEKWLGYPVPQRLQEDEDEDEVWKGYPGPTARRASSHSSASEVWKGYQATKMEADWQRESALKVHEHEWQGYTLETLDENELDSSTTMNGEFAKSRKVRRYHV